MHDVLLLTSIGAADGPWWYIITHNWALVSMLITGTILIGTPYLVLRKYVRIMLNIIRDTPPPLSMGPCDFQRLEGEKVNFRAFDNLNLRGMFLYGDHGGWPKGIIIFAHEFSSDLYSCARYCRPLLKAGYDVFSFDFRGHGESSAEPGYQPRQWPTEREVNDMLGAIAYVDEWLRRRGRPSEMGIFGISRGAGAALIAAQHNPAVKVLVTDGAFSSDTTLEHLMKRWAYIFAKVRFVYENHPPQFWRFLRWLLFRECRRKLGCTFPSVRKALKRMRAPRPILFIHGQKDSYIPVRQSQLLYDLAPGPKSLWVVPDAKHNQSVVVRPEYYAARTVAFFDEHLANPVRSEPPEADQESARPVDATVGFSGRANPRGGDEPDPAVGPRAAGGKVGTASGPPAKWPNPSASPPHRDPGRD